MTTPWLQICGETNPDLELRLQAEVERRINSHDYSVDGISSISTKSLEIKGLENTLSDGMLEKYRRLCQLWDIELYPFKIESHRKFIGPLIVFSKKIFFRIIKGLLKDLIEQQREFNATVVSAMLESEKRSSSNPHYS